MCVLAPVTLHSAVRLLIPPHLSEVLLQCCPQPSSPCIHVLTCAQETAISCGASSTQVTFFSQLLSCVSSWSSSWMFHLACPLPVIPSIQILIFCLCWKFASLLVLQKWDSCVFQFHSLFRSPGFPPEPFSPSPLFLSISHALIFRSVCFSRSYLGCPHSVVLRTSWYLLTEVQAWWLGIWSLLCPNPGLSFFSHFPLIPNCPLQLICLDYYYYYFWPCCAILVCGILVPWPGSEPSLLCSGNAES